MADYPQLQAYLPRLLLYPLQTASALTIAVLGTLLWVGLLSIASIFLLAIVVPWLTAYSDLVIDRTVRGEAEAPRLGGAQAFLTEAANLRGLVLPALLLAAWWPLHGDHLAAATAVLLGGGFLLPAFLLLSNQFGLFCALNPLQLIRTIWILGSAYLLAAFSLAASLALLMWSANQFNTLALVLITLYLLILNCHLIAYLAYFRSEQLDLQPDIETSTQDDERAAEQHLLLQATRTRLAAALRRQDRTEALAVLRATDAETDIDDPVAFHQALFSDLVLRPQKAVTIDQAQRLITHLIRANLLSRALQVYRQAVDLSPDFLPLDMPGLLRLAQYARAEGLDVMFGTICRPAKDFAGESPVAIDLAYEYACDLSDRRNNDAKALEILKAILPHCPGHARQAQIESLARVLEKTAPPASAGG